jgi:hypothetical protein
MPKKSDAALTARMYSPYSPALRLGQARGTITDKQPSSKLPPARSAPLPSQDPVARPHRQAPGAQSRSRSTFALKTGRAAGSTAGQAPARRAVSRRLPAIAGRRGPGLLRPGLSTAKAAETRSSPKMPRAPASPRRVANGCSALGNVELLEPVVVTEASTWSMARTAPGSAPPCAGFLRSPGG